MHIRLLSCSDISKFHIGRYCFFDFVQATTDFQRVKLLRGVYNSVDDIDLFIGMTLEKPSDENNLAGDTFLCLIGDQFARLKWGDRYFYDLSSQEGSLNQCNIPIFFISMF